MRTVLLRGLRQLQEVDDLLFQEDLPAIPCITMELLGWQVQISSTMVEISVSVQLLRVKNSKSMEISNSLEQILLSQPQRTLNFHEEHGFLTQYALSMLQELFEREAESMMMSTQFFHSSEEQVEIPMCLGISV